MTSDLAIPALLRDLRRARACTLALVEDLDDEQWLGPVLEIVNPPLWEIGHVAWFQEHWVLRHARRRPPLRADADACYDSMAVQHDRRWQLALPPRQAVLRYAQQVEHEVAALLESGDADDSLLYFVRLAAAHEDMHAEALLYTRQTLGYRAPRLPQPAAAPPSGGPCPGDAAVPGARFPLGADAGAPFVFDNEKQAHEVEVAAFRLARAPVTEAEFAAFAGDLGYGRRELWSDEGWTWRTAAAASQPVYWRQERPGSWLVREFDRWRPLQPHRPVLHVNWFEADAFCRWAGRRLPSEAEWELAACGAAPAAARKRTFPWGGEPPAAARALLDMASLGCAEVGALPAGDGPFGHRQLLGNVWEWTATTFGPYPGFLPDPYKDYSAPWFGTRKVLRGGCFATAGRLLRNTYRNFFPPDRRDVFAGFRTAAP